MELLMMLVIVMLCLSGMAPALPEFASRRFATVVVKHGLPKNDGGMAPARSDYATEITGRFAKNLVRLRQEAGLSQEELAFRASIHRTQISLMESGNRLPRFETLVKLVGALGVSPEALMEGIVWEPNVSRAGGFKVTAKS